MTESGICFVDRLAEIARSGQKALFFQNGVDQGRYDFETIKVELENPGHILGTGSREHRDFRRP